MAGRRQESLTGVPETYDHLGWLGGARNHLQGSQRQRAPWMAGRHKESLTGVPETKSTLDGWETRNHLQGSQRQRAPWMAGRRKESLTGVPETKSTLDGWETQGITNRGPRDKEQTFLKTRFLKTYN